MPPDGGTQRSTKPPAHVPTFAARGGLLPPRLLLLALVALLATAVAGGLLGPGSSPPSSLTAPTSSGQVDATDPATDAQPEPVDSGPAGAPLPAGTPSPPPPKQLRPTSAPPEELTGYEWPLRGARITSRFGARNFGGFVVIDGDEIHDGLDLARFCGFKVRAAHDGVVLYAGRKFDDYIGYHGSAADIYSRLQRQGRLSTLPIVVVIDDGNGYRSMYVHLSRADVEAGDVVKAGDVIGREGATGFATGCHLHYTLIRMDGAWQTVAPNLYQYGYPTLVRERVNPLIVLSWDDPHAPERLRNRTAGESASPGLSPFVGPSGEPSLEPSPGASSPVQPSASASASP